MSAKMQQLHPCGRAPSLCSEDNADVGFGEVGVSPLFWPPWSLSCSSVPICTCCELWVCAQSCPTLCNPMDWSQTGSSVLGNFQAEILGWVAISYYSGSSRPRIPLLSLASPALVGRFFTTGTPRKPHLHVPLQKLILVKYVIGTYKVIDIRHSWQSH